MAGNKETKEAVVAAVKVLPVLIKHFKDGVQVDDFAKVYSDLFLNAEMKQALQVAYEDAKLINEEVKDLDMTETLDILGACMPELIKVIQAAKA